MQLMSQPEAHLVAKLVRAYTVLPVSKAGKENKGYVHKVRIPVASALLGG